jgi:hypothetical protein
MTLRWFLQKNRLCKYDIAEGNSCPHHDFDLPLFSCINCDHSENWFAQLCIQALSNIIEITVTSI